MAARPCRSCRRRPHYGSNARVAAPVGHRVEIYGPGPGRRIAPAGSVRRTLPHALFRGAQRTGRGPNREAGQAAHAGHQRHATHPDERDHHGAGHRRSERRVVCRPERHRIRRYPRPAADLHRYTNHNHVRPLLVLRHGGRHQRAGGAGDSQAGQTRRPRHQDDGHRRHVHAHRKPPYAPVRRRHAARCRVRSRAAQRADRRSYVVGAGHAKLRRGRNSSTDTRPMARLRPGEEAGVRPAGRGADGGKRTMGGPHDRAPPPRGRGACR